MKRTSVRLLLFPLLACLYWLSHAPAISAGSAQEPLALLSKARQAAGGPALTAIRTLSVDTGRPSADGKAAGFDLMLPARFHLRTAGIAHTLDGDRFWQSRTTAAATQALAKRTTQVTFAANSLLYLLRVPAILNIQGRESGTRPFGDKGLVDVLTFTGDHGFHYELFLDRNSSLPVGATWNVPAPSGGAVVTARVASHQTVQRVKFPKVIEFAQEVNGRTYDATQSVVIRTNGNLDHLFATR